MPKYDPTQPKRDTITENRGAIINAAIRPGIPVTDDPETVTVSAPNRASIPKNRNIGKNTEDVAMNTSLKSEPALIRRSLILAMSGSARLVEVSLIIYLYVACLKLTQGRLQIMYESSGMEKLFRPGS